MPDGIDSKTENRRPSASQESPQPPDRSGQSSAASLRARQLSRGDWIQVKSAAVIRDLIDSDGTTDGLPFMPEMLQFCGQRFQVSHFANKVCANVGTIEIRNLQNVVVLKVSRCDGCFHGGCQMACELLWKLDWLEPVPTAEDGASSHDPLQSPEASQLTEKLVPLSVGTPRQEQAKSSGQYFRCQATELGAASGQSSPLHFGQYLVDRKTNGTSWSSIFKFITQMLIRKVLRRSESVAGPCKRTPVDTLNLKVDDRVKVKPIEEILETLDAKGCNRGLWFDPAEMQPFCGKTLTVTRRIDRIIDEGTGELLEMKVPSIVLNETQCSGLHRRFCSRAMLHFWREVWLERVDR